MENLKKILTRIDGKGYPAYKDLKGFYRFPDFSLIIDRVQGDPFASPTRIRIVFDTEKLGIPDEFLKSPEKMAVCDYLGRVAYEGTKRVSRIRGSGKSGLITIQKNGQEILDRTNVVFRNGKIEFRLQIGLPARGRRITGREAQDMFFSDIPRVARHILGYDKEKLNTWVVTIKNYHIIKEEIEKMGIVAFIPDGAILPRRTGVDDRPLEGAVPFRSPESLRVEIRLSYGETISGMGILEGVTLITGGGYHGKSTLLRAIERGVYPHIPGDGREYVVTRDTAVKIRAEDGRRVEKVDISPFISYLPYGKNTEEFSTDNASGSTSQAANIMEFIELGAKLLLLDEDTCATNFMIRDERMQELIAKENEPITPFIDRVRELYENLGISTILVMGGAGDYLDVADRVIMMKEFIPYDVSERAREIIRIHPTRRKIETSKDLRISKCRIPLPDSIDPSRGRKVKIKARDIDEIGFGRETIDLSCVEQIVETAQTKAIGMAIYRMREDVMDGKKTIRECVDWIEERLKQSGVDFLNKGFSLDLSRPRGIEIGAGLNRLRTLKVKHKLKTG